jgi:hypothetical protein
MAITNGYITLNLLKSALSINDEIDDDFLELAINAASRQIDQVCERQFFSTTETRLFAPRDSFICEIDDLTSLTTLETSSSADGVFDVQWESKDLQLEPLNSLAGGIPTPFTQIRAVDEYLFPTDNQEATVKVTGTFGFTPVPDQVQQATVILAARLAERRFSPLGVAGFGDLGAVRVSRFLDGDVDNLISPFKKIRFA